MAETPEKEEHPTVLNAAKAACLTNKSVLPCLAGKPDRASLEAEKHAEAIAIQIGIDELDSAQREEEQLVEVPADTNQEGGSSTVAATAPKEPLWLRIQQRAKTSAQAYSKNVRRHPFLLLLPPILVFAVCVALGVYGVVAGANQQAKDTRTVTTGLAMDWTASLKLSLEQTFTPLVTLSIFIKRQTDYRILEPQLPDITSQVLASLPNNSIAELQISPMGVISSIFQGGGMQIPDVQGRLNGDIFAEPALRGGAIATVKARALVLNGPLYLINSQRAFGAIVRLPIFIQNSTLNDTFGTDRELPTNCTDLCWNPVTHEKFWGFVTALLDMQRLHDGTDPILDPIKQKRYNYVLARPYTSTEANPDNQPMYVFANSSSRPVDPVAVNFTISNAVWTAYIAPASGWQPHWRNGLIALVVLGSAVLAILVGVIVASWAQQSRLLGEVLETNTMLAKTTHNLEEEKLRLDALLVRQYNLISVLGKHSPGRGDDEGETSSSTASKEGLTLEKIESMRRQLAVNNNSSKADIESIQVLELLGEGTFGKVYKGLWRGTVVAVKTMVLPANMTGAEKREKMAVMEAAISSSLSHPNIVQTYTYAIKPITEHHPPQLDGDVLVGNTLTQTGGSLIRKQPPSTSTAAPGSSFMTNMSVHSYEVRLVLEFCDRGSLRDALDSGAFLSDTGLNYRAVLDVCADVGAAMLHLHSLNVLHSDLKARNVMLKSGGQAGRPVTAKVADFGLSLKMEQQETHLSGMFQGTMTHMAPEMLLEGRASKAADVYAFGITMWELFTGGHAFQGVPRALLGHQITRNTLRPRFPAFTPAKYRELAEECWHPIADMRPDFQQVLDTIMAMRKKERGNTPPLAFPTFYPNGRNGNGNGNGGSTGDAVDPAAVPLLAGNDVPLGLMPERLPGKNGSGASTRPPPLFKIQEAEEHLEGSSQDGHDIQPTSPASTQPVEPGMMLADSASLPAGLTAGLANDADNPNLPDPHSIVGRPIMLVGIGESSGSPKPKPSKSSRGAGRAARILQPLLNRGGNSGSRSSTPIRKQSSKEGSALNAAVNCLYASGDNSGSSNGGNSGEEPAQPAPTTSAAPAPVTASPEAQHTVIELPSGIQVKRLDSCSGVWE